MEMMHVSYQEVISMPSGVFFDHWEMVKMEKTVLNWGKDVYATK
jgi:hypothetical protein